jgi:drug/metabolite transporter (DMT)-like permease
MTQGHRKRLLAVWTGLAAAVTLDTAIQIFWKAAVAGVPSFAGALDTINLILRQPLSLVVIILVLIQFLNWMAVLRRTDLSYAQPITSLSLISVTTVSFYLFHERVSLQRIAGMLLILAGVWFISMTGHRTPRGAAGGQPGNPEQEVGHE